MLSNPVDALVFKNTPASDSVQLADSTLLFSVWLYTVITVGFVNPTMSAVPR